MKSTVFSALKVAKGRLEDQLRTEKQNKQVFEQRLGVANLHIKTLTEQIAGLEAVLDD